MRLFGILLIVVNLLAGAGYIYLATQDWKGRQTINAAGLRHLLLLQGLPLEGQDFSAEDETPFQVFMAGGESTKTVSKKLLESYFQANTSAGTAAPPAGAPGVEPTPAAPKVALATNTAVTNQVAELKRVFGVLKTELGKEGLTPEAKTALLASWLLLQAETMNERIQFQTLITANDADELAHLLDRKIYRVAPKLLEPAESAPLAPAKWQELQKKIADAPSGPDAATLKLPVSADESERRVRLAHLLVHLDRDAAWQKRVIAVVGLRRYVHAVSTQISRFREMKDQVELPIAIEQASFQKHQDKLLNETRQNLDRARAHSDTRAQLTEQKTAQDDAVNRRRTQLKDLEAQLKKVKTEVDELLVQQTGIEKGLYEIQREVGLTLEEVYRLETLLTDIERERYGIPPRTKP